MFEDELELGRKEVFQHFEGIRGRDWVESANVQPDALEVPWRHPDDSVTRSVVSTPTLSLLRVVSASSQHYGFLLNQNLMPPPPKPIPSYVSLPQMPTSRN